MGGKAALGLSVKRVFFETADGVFYLFTDSSSDSSGQIVPLKNIYIDINGAKAPNKFGEDVFVFKRINGVGIKPEGYYSSTPCCNRNNSGVDCAARIMADGWKIKY